MVILGGQAKGLSLSLGREVKIRPTAVMMRRKIFDAHQDLSGYHFVDLCGGSGAMGLEAWSRGALSVVFCEKDRRAYEYLRKNLKRFAHRYDCTHRPLRLVKGDCLKLLEEFWMLRM